MKQYRTHSLSAQYQYLVGGVAPARLSPALRKPLASWRASISIRVVTSSVSVSWVGLDAAHQIPEGAIMAASSTSRRRARTWQGDEQMMISAIKSCGAVEKLRTLRSEK